MKKLFPVLLMFVFSTSYAQLEKGSKLAGVQLNLLVNDMYYTSLGFGNSGYEKYFGISLVPTYGYALHRNWLIGVQATVGFETSKFDAGGIPYTSRTLSTDFGLAPFTRFYLDLTRKGKLKVFGTGALECNIASQRISYSSGGSPGRFSKTSLHPSLGGGIAYFGRRNSFDLSMSTQALRIGLYKVIGPHKK